MAAITIALAAKHLAMQLTQAYDAQYKALYNAAHQNSLFLNVWTLNTLIYHPFLVPIDIFCWVLTMIKSMMMATMLIS